MRIFDMAAIMNIIHEAASIEALCTMQKQVDRGAMPPAQSLVNKVEKLFKQAEVLLGKHGLKSSVHSLEVAKHQWNRGSIDYSAGAEIFHRFQLDIISEFDSKIFFKIEEDRIAFINNDNLFGDSVSQAFPSATTDIKESANCLFAECPTAAVFHLMRAVEFALRAVAKDRNISFKDKPLDEKEWGQILIALESCLSDLRKASRSCWNNPANRDIQIRFYNEIVQELRSFNDAWRKHVSHADSLAFYDRDSALGIFNHVHLFMQKISEKISEDSKTAEYW